MSRRQRSIKTVISELFFVFHIKSIGLDYVIVYILIVGKDL